jgi:hypothetical protein
MVINLAEGQFYLYVNLKHGPEIQSRWRRNFPHTSRQVLGSTQLLIQWVPFFPAGKAARAWRQPPTSPQRRGLTSSYNIRTRKKTLQNSSATHLLPLCAFMTCHRVNFTFILTQIIKCMKHFLLRRLFFPAIWKLTTQPQIGCNIIVDIKHVLRIRTQSAWLRVGSNNEVSKLSSRDNWVRPVVICRCCKTYSPFLWNRVVWSLLWLVKFWTIAVKFSPDRAL